jgi:hypothetical protein
LKAKVEIIPDYFGEKRLQATPVFNKKKKKRKEEDQKTMVTY